MDSALKGQQGQGRENGDGGAARDERSPRGMKGKRPGMVRGGGAVPKGLVSERPALSVLERVGPALSRPPTELGHV